VAGIAVDIGHVVRCGPRRPSATRRHSRPRRECGSGWSSGCHAPSWPRGAGSCR
jgi:hypothetical protein